MTKLKLVTAPNIILKTVSEPIEKVDKDIQLFLDNMLETMYEEHGAGLAAIQVGVPQRIMIVDVGKKDNHEEKEPHYFINPKVVWYSEETISYNEGCLSLPSCYAEVSRPRDVIVQYLDYHGKEQERQVTDWLARGVQHELDHLNGLTLIDKVSKLKGELLLRKVIKYKRIYSKGK